MVEILDDVGAHLADLTAELGTGTDADIASLAARLGTAAAYAAAVPSRGGVLAGSGDGDRAGPALRGSR